MTGTVGLKVTLGRWSTDGVVPLSPTFDTPGLLARSVSDVAYGFAALDPAGIDPDGFIARAGTRDLAGVRIGVGDPFLWGDCDPGIAETVHESVNALAHAGAVGECSAIGARRMRGQRFRPPRGARRGAAYRLRHRSRLSSCCGWGRQQWGRGGSAARGPTSWFAWTLRWREMDSNYWYRGTKAVDFRSTPGIARVSAGLGNDTT